MKKSILLFSLIALYSCDNKYNPYQKINLETYSKYIPLDTLLQKENVLITKVQDSKYPIISKILIKKSNSYFIFDTDCYLENDSTIIAYAPPFQSDLDNGSFQKNGIWLYTEFYTEENKKGNSIYEISDSGAKFSVDSLPQNLNLRSLPKSEGIYFFENNSLKQVSAIQSEDAFYKLNKNGFYFLPNTGRLFEHIKISSIK
ncbi:hypothetical protein ACEN2I_15615 [Flavobacterium sp. W22_SRS_FK3]|uniref:hypothetical protein n=1 Tax=Flavobacterium sp. W22_SRS_FK3 TaxID=3240275 RepID=UPI003F8EF133